MEMRMMKKTICFLTVLMLCAALMVPAFAANEFTPSVSDKPAPDIVPLPEGGIAVILNDIDDPTPLDIVYEGCLVITPVSEANTSTEIPDYARDLLLEVYGKLKDGSMTLPYEKFSADLDPDAMVIRDLFDATFVCKEHPEMLLPEGVVLQITFDLGVDADETVYTMSYHEGEWSPIVSTVNNGDGTVTCTFEHLCPIAFSVETDVKPPVVTGDPAGDQLGVWFILAGVALVALVALVVVYKVNSKKIGE